MSPAGDSPARLRRPSWAGRNYTLLTAAALVTNLGSQGALIAAAFAVLDEGGDGGMIRRYIIWPNDHAQDKRLRKIVARADAA